MTSLMRARGWLVLVLVGLAACDNDEAAAGGFGDSGGEGISGPTAATDGDFGGDGGAKGGPLKLDVGGGDPADEPPPVEDEMQGNFRVPRASGSYVYSASESTDSVAVIDSDNLTIDVVGVGRGPTVIAPLAIASPELGAVAVLDERSDDVAIVRTDELGESTVEIFEVTTGANNLAVSPDGGFVFVYADIDGPSLVGPGSDQEVSVIDIASGQVNVMTVGAHPRDIAFAPDSQHAYIVTADGVNVVPMSQVAMLGKPDITPVYTDSGVDPSRLEVLVAAEHGVALARVEGESRLVITDLLTREVESIEIDGIPTDLDIAGDNRFALLTVPRLDGSSRLIELDLPFTPGEVELRTSSLPEEYVGLAQLSPDGTRAVLYTTQNPFVSQPPVDPPSGTTTGTTGTTTGEGDTSSSSDASDSSSSGDVVAVGAIPQNLEFGEDPTLRVTIARRRDNGTWDTSSTLFNDRPVGSVGIAPDGDNAIVIHRQTGDAVPFGYTLIDLSKEFPTKKLQTIEVDARDILFTPSGDRAVVLLADAGVRRVEQVDLRTFIVAGLELGSPPEGAGFVESTQKVFVSQAHPTGRITFIDEQGSIQTVTGFRLNDAVKD